MSHQPSEAMSSPLVDWTELQTTDLSDLEDDSSQWGSSTQTDLSSSDIGRIHDEVTSDSANSLYELFPEPEVWIEFHDNAIQRGEWFNELERELDELATLADNHDSEGSRAVNPEAIQAGKMLAALLYDTQRVQCSQFGPEPNGGVELVAEHPDGLWEMAFWISRFDHVEYSIERGKQNQAGIGSVFEAIDKARDILGQ